MNLVKNAEEAMEGTESPVLSVSAKRVVGDEGYVEIIIKDNGMGIPPDKLSSIFDPYFTTKGPEKGTGLGLAIVKRIIEEHGGTITVDSEAGKGTAFTIRLPIKSSSTEDVRGPASSNMPQDEPKTPPPSHASPTDSEKQGTPRQPGDQTPEGRTSAPVHQGTRDDERGAMDEGRPDEKEDVERGVRVYTAEQLEGRARTIMYQMRLDGKRQGDFSTAYNTTGKISPELFRKVYDLMMDDWGEYEPELGIAEVGKKTYLFFGLHGHNHVLRSLPPILTLRPQSVKKYAHTHTIFPLPSRGDCAFDQITSGSIVGKMLIITPSLGRIEFHVDGEWDDLKEEAYDRFFWKAYAKFQSVKSGSEATTMLDLQECMASIVSNNDLSWLKLEFVPWEGLNPNDILTVRTPPTNNRSLTLNDPARSSMAEPDEHDASASPTARERVERKAQELLELIENAEFRGRVENSGAGEEDLIFVNSMLDEMNDAITRYFEVEHALQGNIESLADTAWAIFRDKSDLVDRLHENPSNRQFLTNLTPVYSKFIDLLNGLKRFRKENPDREPSASSLEDIQDPAPRNTDLQLYPIVRKHKPELLQVERSSSIFPKGEVPLDWDDFCVWLQRKFSADYAVFDKNQPDGQSMVGFYIGNYFPHSFQLLSIEARRDYMSKGAFEIMVKSLKAQLNIKRMKRIIYILHEGADKMQVLLRDNYGFRTIAIASDKFGPGIEGYVMMYQLPEVAVDQKMWDEIEYDFCEWSVSDGLSGKASEKIDREPPEWPEMPKKLSVSASPTQAESLPAPIVPVMNHIGEAMWSQEKNVLDKV